MPLLHTRTVDPRDGCRDERALYQHQEDTLALGVRSALEIIAAASFRAAGAQVAGRRATGGDGV